MLQTVRKSKHKSSSAKLSSRSISKSVKSVIRENVAVQSADLVKSSLHNASRSNFKNRKHAVGACEEINLANVGHPTALGAGVENGNTRQLSLAEAVICRHCQFAEQLPFLRSTSDVPRRSATLGNNKNRRTAIRI